MIWYWKGDSKGGSQDVWIRFDDAISKGVEEAKQAKEKKFKVDDERFIDIKKMVQARYDNPKRRRGVKRETPAMRRAAAAKAAKKAGAAKPAPKKGKKRKAPDAAPAAPAAPAATAAAAPRSLSDLPANIRNGLVDATTRFYSSIPHSFGNGTPPVLMSTEALKAKTKLLDELLQLEQTARIIRSAGDEGGASADAGAAASLSPLDTCYRKLNCELSVLPPASPEHQLITEMLGFCVVNHG